jgi:hypothetical protein
MRRCPVLFVGREAERFRERYVKGAESYQILCDAGVDGLFDLFETRFSTAP